MSSDPKGPETIPLTAEADEHEGHYAWEVEPFDPEGPVGIVISMADVECGQPLDATLVVLADSDDEREVEWARSTADDIAARLNEHQAQAATIAELQREIGGYRQALENCIDDATARALVIHFGLKGAIDYATKIFQMGGPLAKEYGWLADYLTTYKAATEVGRWPKEFER
jgi:hypothetical protein